MKCIAIKFYTYTMYVTFARESTSSLLPAKDSADGCPAAFLNTYGTV